MPLGQDLAIKWTKDTTKIGKNRSHKNQNKPLTPTNQILGLATAFFIFLSTPTTARIVSAYFGFTSNNGFGFLLSCSRNRR